VQDGLRGDACGIGVGMPTRVATELLKFFGLCKQVVDPSCELTGPLYPITCMPAFFNQLTESAFVAGRGIEYQYR
jgi:hypothetical protein